jgi:putative ABC transport system permease protein
MTGVARESALRVDGASHLAVRNLLQDKTRLALSVAGIALAVMLIIFLLGLREGVFRGAVAYLDNAPGTVVVLPEGVRSTAGGSARLLPPETIESVLSVPEVREGAPVLLVVAVPEWHGTREAVRLIGYEVGSGTGPWDLASGREPSADNEIVIDRALAARHSYELGDTVEFAGTELTVSGLSNGTSSLVGSYVFARTELVESLILAPGSASFLLLTPQSGAGSDDLITGLQDIPGINALPKSDVMDNNRQVLANIVDSVIFVMVGAAFVVGALVVGMVIYTATIERQREYGVLKAIGARNGMVYRIVISQAAIAAGIGVLAGVALAFAVGWFVTSARPQFPVVIDYGAIAATLAAGFIMALIGALVPARAVARLAPADVFRR